MRQDVSGLTVVDHGGRHQAKAGVVVLVVIPWKKDWQKPRASSIEPKRSGKPGRYFKVRNWLSEYGLSSETCGRLWVLTTPRSASNRATGLDFMEEPRSAWTVSWPGAMFCARQLC